MNEKQQVKLEVVRQNKMKNGQKSLITVPHTPKYPKNSARFQLFLCGVFFFNWLFESKHCGTTS